MESILSVILLPELHLFTMVGLLLVVVLVLEVTSLLLSGCSLTGALDHMHSIDIHHEFPWLNWVLVKDLPLLIYLVLSFGFFIVSGYSIQAVAMLSSHAYLPIEQAAPLAILISIVASRFTGAAIGRLIAFKSLAISESEFIGMAVIVKSDKITQALPGEVSLIDRNNTTHYLNAAPLNNETFLRGDIVFVRSGQGSLYFISSEPVVMA